MSSWNYRRFQGYNSSILIRRFINYFRYIHSFLSFYTEPSEQNCYQAHLLKVYGITFSLEWLPLILRCVALRQMPIPWEILVFNATQCIGFTNIQDDSVCVCVLSMFQKLYRPIWNWQIWNIPWTHDLRFYDISQFEIYVKASLSDHFDVYPILSYYMVRNYSNCIMVRFHTYH